jgi:Fic family protein
MSIARYQEALLWSPIATQFIGWMTALQAVGTQQLAGTTVSAADVLQSRRSSDHPAVSRLINAHEIYANSQNIDATLALQIANDISPREVSLRRRVANQGEMVGIPADFIPPSGAERLQHLMNDWQQFVSRGAADMNPLMLMGIAHCQLMCIRPFTFANTATVQLMDQRMLFEEGVVSEKARLPLAWQFSHRAVDYWRLQIDAVSQQRWEPWLLFFLQKVSDTAQRCTDQLHALGHLQRRLERNIEDLFPSMGDVEALAMICAQPSCGIVDVVDAGLAKRQTAANYLSKMVDTGQLRECRVGKEKRFINDAAVGILLGDV